MITNEELKLLKSGIYEDMECINDPEWTTDRARRLLEEVKRLRNGDLTPQELQNVCHNLHQKKIDCTRQEFRLGCDLMIEKLFGPEDARTDFQKGADMRVEAAIKTRLQYQEELAAAYLQKVGIPPEEAVLCEQTGADGVIRWWFERKNTRT
jgi:hypothetical protein